MPNIVPVFISYAGCPHQCAFCNQHSINGQQEFSLAAVQEQAYRYLSYFTEEAEKEIAFYGGSFTGLPEKWQETLLDFAQEMAATDNVVQIRLSTRPDYIDENVIVRLKKYKVALVELGVQSLDDKVLSLAKRGHDKEAVFKAARLLKEAGIAFGVQLMVGLPRQDWESIKDTAAQVIALAPSVVRIYPLVIFAGTDFGEQFKSGCLNLTSFDEVASQAAYLVEQFNLHGIKIIRLGLQEDEGLHEQGAVLGGFHHPAFGEIVASLRCRKEIERLIKDCKSNRVALLVPEKRFSQAVGHKKMNVDYFKEKYPAMQISFLASEGDSLRIG